MGWEDFFEVIIGSGDSIKLKPSHNPVLPTLSLCGAENIVIDGSWATPQRTGFAPLEVDASQ